MSLPNENTAAREKRVSLVMPADLVEAIDAAAKASHRRRSGWLRWAAQRVLAEAAQQQRPPAA